ncbi:MAG: hypothetical protein WC100_14865 [Sterolibacterium sp.]
MARRQITPPSQRIVTQYRDADGNLVLQTEYNERIVIANGEVTHIKQGENIQLVSGEMFNPAMAAGQHPVLVVGLCHSCQGSPRVPLTNAKHLRICAGCGRPSCPIHRRQSRYDKKWRCLRCYRRHRMGLLFRGIFLERA